MAKKYLHAVAAADAGAVPACQTVADAVFVDDSGAPTDIGGAVADGSVTTAKIADGAVTAAKIAAGVIPTVPEASKVDAVSAADCAAAEGANPTQAEYAGAVALANECKAKLNAVIAALKGAGLMADA